jgi:hypothetical protein
MNQLSGIREYCYKKYSNRLFEYQLELHYYKTRKHDLINLWNKKKESCHKCKWSRRQCKYCSKCFIIINAYIDNPLDVILNEYFTESHMNDVMSFIEDKNYLEVINNNMIRL